jgi:pimeloyl-ACP methyl ester carboxylesterase
MGAQGELMGRAKDAGRRGRRCLDEDEVVAFSRGRASQEQRFAVELHLTDCSRCLEWVANMAKAPKQWLFADPLSILKTLHIPTLVIQGDNDLQVPTSDAKTLAAAWPGIKLVILPGVSHTLKLDTASTPPQSSYTDADRPIAPGIVEALLSLVK